ncbi:hypothetical protein HMPREF9309_01632, partial [Campylobacter ureolyticus ACS-301-V-Sch3b]
LYDDELYFLIISKEINYKRIIFLAFFMLTITIMASTLCKMLYEMRKREKIVKCLGVRY